MNTVDQNILRTVLYYDIFDHPLAANEMFMVFPINLLSVRDLEQYLENATKRKLLGCHAGKYFLPSRGPAIVQLREEKERLARKRWFIARFVTHIIKRFPFVRGIFVSGDLAKDVSSPKSDIDFFIVAESQRLWICRSLLILFKKIILFNSKKFFCLNYFLTARHLEVSQKNYFTAVEIAHLKSLYNYPLLLKFLDENGWVERFFPNYRQSFDGRTHSSERRSFVQLVVELPFRGRWGDQLDQWLMEKMRNVWKRRYPHLSEEERDNRFRTSPDESSAYTVEHGKEILTLYAERLRRFGLLPPPTYD
jgi:hypothetical protein